MVAAVAIPLAMNIAGSALSASDRNDAIRRQMAAASAMRVANAEYSKDVANNVYGLSDTFSPDKRIAENNGIFNDLHDAYMKQVAEPSAASFGGGSEYLKAKAASDLETKQKAVELSKLMSNINSLKYLRGNENNRMQDNNVELHRLMMEHRERQGQNELNYQNAGQLGNKSFFGDLLSSLGSAYAMSGGFGGGGGGGGGS